MENKKQYSISVITPSVRPDRLEIVASALSIQTIEPLEWLICGPEKNRKIVNETIINISPFRYLGNPLLQKGMFWDLNYSYNRLFKESKGELIVSLQDSIWIPPLGLQKFWEAYQSKGDKAIFSGVGDQYAKLDEYGKPIIKVWEDPRKTDKYGDFYRCVWNDCEWNWAAFSRKAIFDIGGTDSDLDFRGYGGDQLQVDERWNDAGYEFWLDQTNESFTLKHGRKEGWDKNHVLKNGEYDRRKQELKESGKWPHIENI